MRRSLRVVLLLPILVILSPGAPAQETPPPISETIDVSIMNLDVMVTDKSGQRVYGLTRDDFEIRENGKPQRIVNFAEYVPEEPGDAPGSTAVDSDDPASGSAAAAPGRRTIVILMEAVKLPGIRSKPMFAGFRSMLRDVVRPGDAVAVATFNESLVIVQEFTDDLALLDNAIGVVEKTTAGVTGDSVADVQRQQDFHELAMRNLIRPDDPFDTGAGPDFKYSRKYESGYESDPAAADNIRRAKHEWLRIRQKADALSALMESISGVEGKKLLIMATERFGRYAGAEFFGGTVPERHRGELDTRKIRDALTATANAHGVTLYPLYPKELESRTRNTTTDVRADIYKNDSDADASMGMRNENVVLNETWSLKEIADDTGGRMASGADAILDLLPVIAEDLQSYYSLAYRTVPLGIDVERKVEVKAKNSDYVVRTRREVVEKSPVTKMKDRVIANLYRRNEGARLPITATVGALTKLENGRWSAPIAVRVPIGSLSLIQGNEGHAGTFSVFVASGGPLGLTSDVQQQTQKFAIPPAELERARASHFTYEVAVEVGEASDRVSVGVHDDVSSEYGLAEVKVAPKS